MTRTFVVAFLGTTVDGKEDYMLTERSLGCEQSKVTAQPIDTPSNVPLYYCHRDGNFDCIHAVYMSGKAKRKRRIR